MPRSSLLTSHRPVIISRLDYTDIIYDQVYNSAFHDKLGSVQYNACLAVTDAIKGTLAEKPYQELGLESLKSRRRFKNFVIFIRSLTKNRARIYLI